LDNTSGSSVAVNGITSVTAGSFGFTGSSDLTLSAPISLSSNAVWSVSASTLSLSGNITGAYSLTKGGAGRLVLGGSNAFSGGLTVAGGTLAITRSEALGSGKLTMKAGTILDLGNYNISLGDVSFEAGAGIISTGSGGGSLNLTGNLGAQPGTLGVTLTGSGSFSKSDASETVLVSNNSNTGGYSVAAGTLTLNSNGALSTGTFTISGGSIDTTADNVVLTTGSQVWSGSFGFKGSKDLSSGSSAVTLTQNINLTTYAGTLTVAGSVSGAGGLTKSGNGTLKLTTSSLTYSGSTNVTAGNLEFTPDTGSLALATPVLLGGSGSITVDAGKLLKLTSSLVSTGGSLAGAGSVDVSAVSVGTGSNLYVTTTLAGGVTKTGNGTLTLNGSGAALSNMTVAAGSLRILSAGALGSASLVMSSGTFDASSIQGGTTLSVSALSLNNSSAFNVASGTELNTGTGAVILTQTTALNTVAGTLTVDSLISGGTNGLTKTGLGTLKLAGSTFSGTTTVTTGTLEYKANGTASGPLVVSSGATTKLDGNFSGSVVNVGSLGTMILGGGTLSVGTFSFGSSKTESGGALKTTLGTVTSFVGTLKGSGSISGPGTVMFGAGSTLDVGYSPGVLIVGGGATMMIASAGVAVKYEYDPALPTLDYGNITATGTLASDRIVVNSGGSLTFQNSATMTLTPTYVSGKVLASGTYLEFPLVIVNGGTINALDQNGGLVTVSGTNLDTYFKVASGAVVSGTFSQLAGGTVDVKLFRKSYAAVTPSSGNLRQVASILDSSMLNGGSAAITAIGTLFTSLDSRTTANEIDTILAALNPAPYTELGNVGMNRMMDLQAAIQGHLDTLAIGVLSDVEPSPGEARESSAWTSVYSGWANRDGSASQGLAGYSSRNFGSISGVEHRFGDLTLGLTGAVGSTSATFKQTSSSLSTDTWHAGLYGSAPIDLEDFGVVLDAGLVYGEGDSTVKRSLSGAGLGLGTFTGKVASTEWMAQIGASFPSVLPDDTYTVTPSLHLLYGSYRQGATNEITDGTLAALAARVGAYSQSSVATRLGLQGAKLLRVGQMPARLTASANWLHSFDAAGRQVDISFATPGATAQKFGSSRTGMDAFRIGLGGEIAITDRTRFQLTIDHQLQKGQSNTSGNASIGVQF
jgi:autotransporter-associated beta strand protein